MNSNRNNPDLGVDVIIPVYNAYEDLKLCVNSLIKYVDFEKNKIIFINDCSPDDKILPFLEKICEENEGFILFNNKKNVGFSASVNIGLEYSKRDVILLNTDTIVTSKWIEKMIECAYSRREIGTITPFSNNATLCSIPAFCNENVVPNGFTIETYAELVEACSMKIYPEISVAVGFCMYIKRELIDVIGYFDAITFEKGYGEENDFCNRAIQSGYVNVLCDDTYIFHSGTASFVSDEKRELMQNHERILEKRYPDLMQKNREFVRDNPIKYLQENIILQTAIKNMKKNIMFLSHRDFKESAEDNVGGVQLHLKDMVENLKTDFNLFMVSYDKGYLLLTCYVEYQLFERKIYIGKTKDYYTFYNNSICEALSNYIDEFKIDIIHVHHLYYLSMDIFNIAEIRNIPIIFTIHDYFTICPTLKLLDQNAKYCMDKDNNSFNCAKCFGGKSNIYQTDLYLKNWRNNMFLNLNKCNKIIAPSNSCRDIFSEIYPIFRNKIEVIEHGCNLYEKQTQEKQMQEKQEKNDRFNVAFIGGINTEKGADLISEMIKNVDFYNWHIFGGIGSEKLNNDETVKKTGWYKREELPKLIHRYNIDLICILPIIPETYCYTLSEAIMCGVPLLVTDIGAVGERVRENKCGWIVPYNIKSRDIMKKLDEIKNNQQEYEKVKNIVSNYKIKSCKEMANDYATIYGEIVQQEEKTFFPVDKQQKLKSIMENYFQESYHENKGDNILLNELNRLKLENDFILNSYTFRIIKKINSINCIGLTKIKAIIKKML